jgi:hypothetical protein
LFTVVLIKKKKKKKTVDLIIFIQLAKESLENLSIHGWRLATLLLLCPQLSSFKRKRSNGMLKENKRKEQKNNGSLI